MHAHKRQTHLARWQERLGLQTLADCDEILPAVEQVLRELDAAGKAGKTLANDAEALTAFCDWCVTRKYLPSDPLENLVTPQTTPRTRRRAMRAEEIQQLLMACVPHRRLTYETAFLSGLRANELRHLTVDLLDVDRSGIRLNAKWTKNRESGFQPLPASLVDRLSAFAQSGEATQLYQRFHARKNATRTIPSNPLLYVSSSLSRDFDKDCKAAGIPKYAPGGKLDFHACRVAYINLVIESGVTVKEAQALARHATPQLTMNAYGRTRDDRLTKAVENVAMTIAPVQECVTYVSQQAAAQSGGRRLYQEIKYLGTKGIGGAEGGRTPDTWSVVSL